MPKAKAAHPKTQGGILADMVAGNIDKAIGEAEGSRAALENLSGAAAAEAIALLDRATSALQAARACARQAFETDYK